MFGDHSELEPPDPIPNSEVKRFSADGSVGSPHVRVGHRQALIRKKPQARCVWGFFRIKAFSGDALISHGEIRTESSGLPLLTPCESP